MEKINYFDVNYYVIFGKKFGRLMDVSLKVCDSFSFSIFSDYKSEWVSSKYFEFLGAIDKWRIAEYYDNHPGIYSYSTHDGKPVQTVRQYRLSKESAKFVLKARALVYLKPPDFPEDLILYKNKEVWFRTVSHEYIADFWNISNEEIKMLNNIGINVRY